jgi:transcriptional regulator with XRE-family HTH domain
VAQYPRMDESTTLDPWEPTNVALRLAAAREALGLSKAEFADMIGLDRSSYTKIEKGLKPILPPTAAVIWRLYHIDLNYIYLGEVGGLPSNLSNRVIANLKARRS